MDQARCMMWSRATPKCNIKLNKVQIYCGSTMVRKGRTLLHRRRQTLRVHSTGGNILWREMTSWPPSWKCDVKCQVENPTSSVDAYLLEEHCCKISSRSDLKRRGLRLFWRDRSNKNKKKRMTMVMSSDLKMKMNLFEVQIPVGISIVQTLFWSECERSW